MINLALQSIEKGSSILEIEAAVLRVMEKVNFHPKEIDTELTEAKTDGNLVMVFVVKELAVEELVNLQSEFGKNFHLKILSKSKSDFFLQVEAPQAEFINFGKRYVYQEPKKESSTSQQPYSGQQSRTPYVSSQSTQQNH